MSWFIKAITQNYANFSGRASRAEYWYFMLFYGIFNVVGEMVTQTSQDPAIVIIFLIILLGLLIPTISIGVRRLHDIGKSGWFWFFIFIPCVGGLILLIWAIEDSQPGDNQYGPNPKGIGGLAPQTGKTEAEE